MSEKLRIGRRRVITRPDELKTVAPKESVDLAGDLVFVTTDSVNPGSEYVRQPDRMASLTRPWDRKNRLKTWVHQSVIDTARNTKGADKRWRVLSDRILLWGLTQRRPTIAITGLPVGSVIHVEIMAFSKHALGSITEYELSPESFAVEIQDRVERLIQQYPGHRIVYVDALLPEAPKALKDKGVQVVGRRPVRMPAFHHIDLHTKQGGNSARWLVPVIIGGGAIAYAGLTASGWTTYEAAVSDYETKVAPVEDVYQNGRNTLERMENHEEFLNKTPPEPHRVKTIRAIVGYVAGRENAVLSRITMTTNPDRFEQGGAQYGNGDTDSDFQIVIGVPAEESINALKQARPLMNDLSESAGVSLRMTSFVERTIEAGETATGESEYRFYTLQGQAPAPDRNAEPAESAGEERQLQPKLLGES